MTTGTIEQVRAVAEYAEYVAHQVLRGARPRDFDLWVSDAYGCAFEELGAS